MTNELQGAPRVPGRPFPKGRSGSVATQWKKGVSGNPGGRSKHVLVRAFEELRPAIRRGIRERLERIPPAERAERLRQALERI